MQLIKHSKNLHEIIVPTDDFQIAMLSDIHWDNPKCDWDVLRSHLDYFKKNNIPVMVNGDFFCLMQGRGDNRRNKSDIRPEHNNFRYLDSIVETAVEWWTPYADILTVIGYGNHECYREDTEVLTYEGWKNIKDVTINDKVATFDDKHIYYELPNAVVSKQADKLVHLEGSFSKQVVSAKHAVMYNDMRKVNAEDITEMKDSDLPHGRRLADSITINDNWIELLTAVVMDATLVDHSKYNPKHTKKRIQFKLSIPEKIEYIKSLLDSLNVPYTFKEATKSGVNKLQPYYIRIYGDYARAIWSLLNGVKQLPYHYSKLSGHQFGLMLKALENTDGFRENYNSIQWNTTSKNDVDVIQEACILNGMNFTYSEYVNGSGFKNGKLQYRCRISKEIIKDKKVKIKHEHYEGLVYCLNMPSGCFITRVEGKVAFSGNTGVIKWQETDILQRFVDLLNLKCGTNVQVGGYGGWLVFKVGTRNMLPYKVKYFHGSGGGGIVTKGAINLTRALELYEDFDVFTMGHIHENASRNDVRDMIQHHPSLGYQMKQRQIHLMLTGTYKEEYEDGHHGWHVERGAPPKPIGGRILRFKNIRIMKNGTDRMEKTIDSTKIII